MTLTISKTLSPLALIGVLLLGLAACRAGGDGGGSARPAPALELFAGSLTGNTSVDGTGAAASFISPSATAVDASGNVYVADDSTIRKITPAGVVTTVAGTAGVVGHADGTGTSASFNGAKSLALDVAGNLFVADSGNNIIRKITSTGNVSTFAGVCCLTGSTDTSGGTPSFHSPSGIALDGSGNLYVADIGNNIIRKITPAGVVTTFAGACCAPGHADGTGSAASFNFPVDVALDGAGNVYVADQRNHLIRQITPGGTVSTFAGTCCNPGDTNGTPGTFRNPAGVAVDGSGNIYVSDAGNNIIRKIIPAGSSTTYAGTCCTPGSGDGTGSAVGFKSPSGISVDGSGNLYVAELGNRTVRKIAVGGVVTTLAGVALAIGHADGSGVSATFNFPQGIAADLAGNLLVADQSNNTLRKITPAGVVSTYASICCASGGTDSSGGTPGFSAPEAVAIDSSGNAYVADSGNNVIRKITADGVVTTYAGVCCASGGADNPSTPSFNFPSGIAVDGVGILYVADSNNSTIRNIMPGGVVSTFAGVCCASGHADSPGTPSFTNPIGVAVDRAGTVFVADTFNHIIRKITPAGNVTTFAGVCCTAGYIDSRDGTPRFNFPVGIALDGAGNVYVTDFGNNAIRKITPAGDVSTLAGSAGLQGFVPGALPGVLNRPKYLTVSGTSLYFTMQNGVGVVSNLP